MIPRGRFLWSYLLVVVAPIAGVIVVLDRGADLTASGPAAAGAAVQAPLAQTTLNLSVLLLQVIVIIVASRLLGMLVARLRQPQVIGEMLAGIFLGRSLLGVVAPGI